MIDRCAEKIGGRKASQMLIATLDLLGVRHLIYNANADELGLIETKFNLILLSAMSHLTHGKKVIQDTLPLKSIETIDKICNSFKYCMIGDTLTISLDLDLIEKSNDSIDIDTYIRYFLLTVKATTYSLMTDGFPVRGCIDAGPLIVDKRMVIGRPYVNSLTISESLEFAGVVFTSEALLICRNSIKEPIAAPLKIMVPTKNGTKEMYCLNWTIAALAEQYKDIGAFVKKQFTANGKTMSAAVLPKLENTEHIIRALIHHNKNMGAP